VGRETLLTGGKILTVIAARKSTDDGTCAGDIVSKHVTESAKNLISKLQGRGRKRAHGQAAWAGGKSAKSPNMKKLSVP